MNRLILYVEDDQDDKELILIHFAGEGFQPQLVWTRDGVEALDYLRRVLSAEAASPAMILSDIRMPRMNGLELLARVRSQPAWAEIPFVILSSSGSEDERERAESLGASLYLRKPLGSEESARMVAALRTVVPA